MVVNLHSRLASLIIPTRSIASLSSGVTFIDCGIAPTSCPSRSLHFKTLMSNQQRGEFVVFYVIFDPFARFMALATSLV